MTREEALKIKEITDQCIGTIPGNYVDFIWEHYIRHIEPERSRQSRPCTCSGKYWTQFLFSLKDKVTDTLRESEETPSDIGEF
jgi:hypothetical protein